MACVAEEQRVTQQNDQTSSKKLCEECKTNTFKYKCPGCSRRTCSLTCVNSHKKNSGCTGKRDRTHFVPLSQFDDSTLLSDYNLLEDVKRVAESAQRIRMKVCTYSQFRLPAHLKALQDAAKRARTRLLFFPAGMSKREKNRSRYNSKFKCIYWTVELRFHTTDIALLEHRVRENSTLRSVIEKHLQPSPWKNKLRRFSEVPIHNLKCFIRKDQQGSGSPYRELDLDTPLRELFSHLVIVEYPIIHVYLRTDHYDFEVNKVVRCPPTQPRPKESVRDDTPCPTGIRFREEEIVEDEEAPEPHTIDLHDYSDVGGCKATSHGSQMDDQRSSESSAGVTTTKQSSPIGISRRHATEGSNVLSSTQGEEVEMLDTNIEDIQFDQDLIDAYSFLMDQNNPDDFLDYKPSEGDPENTDVYFADMNELEEGEIPDIA